jgi:RNA polymerase sigma-70 factor (ECF subfamily)
MTGKNLFEKKLFNRLAKKMQKGDKKAAEEIYNKLIKRVYGFCVSRIYDKTIAEDLTQEIFMKVVSKVETYDSNRGDFVNWFWQLARNTLIDYHRQKKTILFSDIKEQNKDGEEFEVIEIEHPEIDYDKRFEIEKIKKFLQSLTIEDQELFQLRFLAELSYTEISKILDKNEGALRVSISRIKKKIKENFKK